MTDEEHKLQVFMFARIFARMTALTEALIAKGILERDDLKAYEELVMDFEQGGQLLFVQIAQQYEEFAAGLGIDFRFADANKGQSPSDPQSPGH